MESEIKLKRLKYLVDLGSDSQMGQSLKQQGRLPLLTYVYNVMASGISIFKRGTRVIPLSYFPQFLKEFAEEVLKYSYAS